jgi:hypothetical protein
LKGDLIFADEEGVPRGHPQALTLVPLGYFLGVTLASPSLSFCPFFTSSHHSPIPTKLPSYKTQHNSISNISVSIIMNQPFLVQVSTKKNTTYKAYISVATSPKVP